MSLKEKVSEQKSMIKMLENEKFIEAKVHQISDMKKETEKLMEAKNCQTADMKKEGAHKLAIAAIMEE